MRILTEEMVRRAIEFIRPSAERILNTKGTTWGPRWVKGVAKVPGLENPILFEFGKVLKTWSPDWGENKDFGEIAWGKLTVTEREGSNTSVAVATRPWNILRGEHLYAGGATHEGICVACSGAMGRTDEALAEMVISAIVMLAFLETERRLKTGQERI